MAGPEKQRTKFNQGTKAFWTSLMDKAKQDFDRDLGEEDFERGLAKKRKKTSPRKSKNRETGDFYSAIKKSAQPGMFTNTGETFRKPLSKVRPPKKSKK
jgi:hypothetical protein